MVRACHRDLDSEDLSPWGMHVGKKPPKAPTTTTGKGGGEGVLEGSGVRGRCVWPLWRWVGS